MTCNCAHTRAVTCLARVQAVATMAEPLADIQNRLGPALTLQDSQPPAATDSSKAGASSADQPPAASAPRPPPRTTPQTSAAAPSAAASVVAPAAAASAAAPAAAASVVAPAAAASVVAPAAAAAQAAGASAATGTPAAAQPRFRDSDPNNPFYLPKDFTTPAMIWALEDIMHGGQAVHWGGPCECPKPVPKTAKAAVQIRSLLNELL